MSILFTLTPARFQSSFFRAIEHIMRRRSGKQMIGPKTRRIIAFMAYIQALRNLAKRDLENKSGNDNILPVDAQMSVPCGRSAKRPFDAFVAIWNASDHANQVLVVSLLSALPVARMIARRIAADIPEAVFPGFNKCRICRFVSVDNFFGDWRKHPPVALGESGVGPNQAFFRIAVIRDRINEELVSGILGLHRSALLWRVVRGLALLVTARGLFNYTIRRISRAEFTRAVGVPLAA